MQRTSTLLAALMLAVPSLAAPAGSVPTTSSEPTATATPCPSSAPAPEATGVLHTEQVCSGTKFTGWDVTGFEYHASYIFTTPAHQNSWGYVNFNITHPGLDVMAECSASSNQLSDFFYGTMPYTCKLADGTTGSVSFNYSRPANELEVTQTWNCPPSDPRWPDERWTAKGKKTVALECTDSTWINPNWTMGDIYSDREVKCKPVDFFLGVTEIQGVA